MPPAIVQSAQAFLDANKGREDATVACTYIAGLLDEIDRMRRHMKDVARCIDNRRVPRQNIMPHVKFALGLRSGDEITG